MKNQPVSVFISYHRKSHEKDIDGLAEALREAGIDPLYDKIFSSRERTERQVRSRIEQADVVIALIGPQTDESDWVRGEVDMAKSKNKDVIPVLVGGATENDLPIFLRPYPAIVNNTVTGAIPDIIRVLMEPVSGKYAIPFENEYQFLPASLEPGGISELYKDRIQMTPRKSFSKHNNRAHIEFNDEYLDHLIHFKKGFRSGREGSNELRIWYKILIDSYGILNRTKLNFLDIGSADGEWLAKIVGLFQSYEKPCEFESLEPIDQGGNLKRSGGKRIKTHVADIERFSASKKFDVINCTHALYYFWDQAQAHLNISRLLRDDGIYVVTLVSDGCVLNEITRFLVGGFWQQPLTAELFIRMLTHTPVFEIDKVETWRGQFHVDTYLEDRQALEGLGHILSRHRLPEDVLNEQIEKLPEFLHRYCRNQERVNKLIFLRKRLPRRGRN